MCDQQNLFDAFENRISPVIVTMPISAEDPSKTSVRILPQNFLQLGAAGSELFLIQGGFRDVSIKSPSFANTGGLNSIKGNGVEIKFLSSNANPDEIALFMTEVSTIYCERGIHPQELAPKIGRPICS